MFYREVQPSLEFSNVVLSFWEFAAGEEVPAPLQHEVFPDGCVSVIYHRNEELNIHNVIVSRLSLESIKVPVFADDVFWGMRISPVAAARILGLNPADFQGADYQKLGNIPHLTENLVEEFAGCRDFTHALKVYENRLRELNFGSSCKFDQKIADALVIIEESKGNVKISQLSKALGLSQRQFERRFKNSSGITPKQFVRARRIRATAISILEKNNDNWADRAAEIGFSDQSHLTHEVVSVTGQSPSSFAEKVKRIDHGNILK